MDEFKKYFQDHRADLDTDQPADELWEGVKNTLHPGPVIHLYKKWIAAACIVIITGTVAFFLANNKSSTLAEDKPPVPDSILKQALPNDLVTIAREQVDGLAAIPKIKNHFYARSAERKARKLIPVTVVGYRDTAKQAITAKAPARRSQPVKPLYGFEQVEASYTSMLDIQLQQIRSQPIYGANAGDLDLFKSQFGELNKEEEKLKKEFIKAADKTPTLEGLVLVYQRKITILKQLQFEINKMNSKVKQTDTGVPAQKPSYIHL